MLTRRSDTEEAGRRALLYFVVPLWIGAGLVDWVHHRRTGIERTAGPRESLLHLAMMAEGLVPALLGLFAEVNAGVLATAIGALAAHEATAVWDVRYAEQRRRVTPWEQHTHSFLEVVPLMGVTLLTVLHWDQFLALFGRGRARPRFALRWKRDPLPAAYVATVLAAVAIFGALPYVEELVRCAQHAGSREPLPRDERAPLQEVVVS